MYSKLALKILLIACVLISCRVHTTTAVPNLSGKLFHGDSVSLQSIAKDKIFLLNIWSTFCGPCLKELPVIEKINARYKSNAKFELVTLALNSESEITRFTTSKDTADPYNRVFRYSGLTKLDLPVITSLKQGYTVTEYTPGKFSASLGANKEVDALNKMFGMQAIPITILFNADGKVIYRTDSSIDDDHVIVNKIDSLLKTI